MRQQFSTVEQVDTSVLPQAVKIVCSNVVNEIRRSRITPETERHKDIWDVSVFGLTGTIRFDAISQPWLRDAVKVWAYNDLPRRRGSLHSKDSIRLEIRSMAALSDSLRIQRPGDRGLSPGLLSRSDIAGFMNRMAFQHASGAVTTGARIATLGSVRRVLTRMRSMGLTRPGGPMAGLPSDFALNEEDIPTTTRADPLGRDLPAEVMRHLCAHLHTLDEMFVPEVRVAVELSMDTGRRPDEICHLRFDCLERDGNGKPVLIYDNIKANRLGRRLPITESTAEVIVRQQQRVRKLYPDEPASSLKLLPRTTKNPFGTKCVRDNWVARLHRVWVSTLPEVMLPTIDEIGRVEPATLRPFDMAKVFLYAYRHTYCQRHADAGVGIDVLAELMDHRSTGTTQGYYRVGEERRRNAVDRLTTMHFDRHGTKIWHEAKALLDSEHVRRAVGQVAVPYGTCSEPSNVAAGGGDCPIRCRCIGCAHFATDVSYLPDLEAYLADLLRSRERLRSALDADDWAKTEATPSDQEITRIRHLISRINAETDALSADEQAQIEQAVTLVRKARNRAVGLGIPRLRSEAPRLDRGIDA
ncbi:tyrosine-type recombinase/integrase [Rhodococcoides yunnanense]|uniref:tyrosine-type recombinase/integrase n=1 Tax=Rhodococcoides yunnanense TaxID=278209 RepID=UPI001FE88E95|nr:site-specific integrase [Rhodococcus yunnanensis]